MSKYFRFFLGTLFIMIVHCSKNQSSESFVVNLADTLNIPMSDWFSSIEIIPLETLESSLLSECTQIEYYHQRYYIYDRRQQAVFVFDTTGKFLFNTLSSKGRGPKQYITNMGIAINRVTGNLEILDGFARTIRIFDKDGSFVKDFGFPEDILPIDEFQSLSIEHYLFYSKSSEENRESIYVYDANQQKVVKKMLMTNSYEDYFVSTASNAFYWIDSTLRFSHTYANNDVYRIDKNLDMRKLYSYDFGRKTFDVKTLPKDEDPAFYRFYDRNNKGKYVFPYIKFESNRYYFCFFSFKDLLYVSRHHKQQGTERMKNEVIYSRFSDGGMIFPPIVFDKYYLYNVIEPLWIPHMMNPLFTDQQKEILNAIPDDSNPIILKYKFK